MTRLFLQVFGILLWITVNAISSWGQTTEYKGAIPFWDEPINWTLGIPNATLDVNVPSGRFLQLRSVSAGDCAKELTACARDLLTYSTMRVEHGARLSADNITVARTGTLWMGDDLGNADGYAEVDGTIRVAGRLRLENGSLYTSYLLLGSDDPIARPRATQTNAVFGANVVELNDSSCFVIDKPELVTISDQLILAENAKVFLPNQGTVNTSIVGPGAKQIYPFAPLPNTCSIRGDVNKDHHLNIADLEYLVARKGTVDPSANLVGSAMIDQADIDELLFNIFRVMPGDANLDCVVDAADLNTLALNWKKSVNSWANADYNADGVVDAADLNELALHWKLSNKSTAGYAVCDSYTDQ